jgi:sec-independent protein translocase protein TatA
LLRGVGTQELLIVLLIVLLIFGARKLPDLARSLGASAKEFRKGIAEGSEDDADAPASGATAAETPAPNTQVPDTKDPD